ncbi:MAG: DM13 domain-containing protein [Scytonema sp. PMC 1069.18]|nr:DM13 domain-containing protein [Scytonema sp. PMC 1069.18]MEC4884978.1 DM13 domain-containing protein [Scytonema sp. PMC 1070.18]
MQLNQLLKLSLVSCLACVLSVSAVEVLTNPSANAISFTSKDSNILIAQRQQVVALSGNFVQAEKPTTGTAKIVTENGQQYLVLDSAFQTSDQGPDLHVLLDPAEKPPMKYENFSRYVNLGKLEKYSGMQRYPIPAAINLSNFKSVVIWCRMANATFGYAPLRPSRAMK